MRNMKKEIAAIGISALVLVFARDAHAVEPGSGQALRDGSGAGAQVGRARAAADDDVPSGLVVSDRNGSGQENGSANGIHEPGTGLEDSESKERNMGTGQAVETTRVMSQLAERNAGVGQQLRVILREQLQNREISETILEKIRNRSGFVRFFVGPDYDGIGNAEKLLERNREQLRETDQIRLQLSEGDRRILDQQLQNLERENSVLESSLDAERGGVSLFGWLFGMFAE